MTMTPQAVGRVAAICGSLFASTAFAQEECKPAYEFPTIEPGVLTIAAPDFPPFFTYKDGVLGGFEGLTFQKFADDNCLDIAVTILPAGGVIEAVKNGLADVAGGGWSVNPQRGEVVGQTNLIYNNLLVYVGKNPSPHLKDYEGTVIGTVTGYNFNNDLEAWGKAEVKYYESPDAGFADLKSGRLPTLILGAVNALYRISLAPESGLTVAYVEPDPGVPSFDIKVRSNIVHTKGNTALTDALNGWLKAHRADGTLAAILEEVGLPTDLVVPAEEAGE